MKKQLIGITLIVIWLISCEKMLFSMAWRNVRADSYYCAYPGQTSATDFGTFHSDTTMYLINKAAFQQLYLP